MEASRTAATNLDTALATFTADHPEENFEMEEPFVSDAQPIDEDFDSEEPFVPTEAEKDAAQRMLTMKSAKAPAKRPRSPVVVDDDVPDLAEIFDNYDTPKATRISVCRSYASYLASMMPKKPKAAPKRKSK